MRTDSIFPTFLKVASHSKSRKDFDDFPSQLEFAIEEETYMILVLFVKKQFSWFHFFNWTLNYLTILVVLV